MHGCRSGRASALREISIDLPGRNSNSVPGSLNDRVKYETGQIAAFTFRELIAGRQRMLNATLTQRGPFRELTKIKTVSLGKLICVAGKCLYLSFLICES